MWAIVREKDYNQLDLRLPATVYFFKMCRSGWNVLVSSLRCAPRKKHVSFYDRWKKNEKGFKYVTKSIGNNSLLFVEN